MIFTVSTTTLLKGLQTVQGAIGSNATLPILEDFLFTLSSEKLTITATDLETTMSCELDVMSPAEGSIAIPAKMLLEIVKALPEQPLTFKIGQDTNSIEIISQNGKYRLAGEAGSDFPAVNRSGEGNMLTMPAKTLLDAISKTLFAVSTDELRPAMTGVYLRLQSDGVTFVATDAHKLVRYLHTDIVAPQTGSFILPRKALGLISKAVSNPDTEVTLSYNNTNAFFDFDGVRLICRLIDARFPDFEAVIPKDNPNVLTINRSELLGAMRRLTIFANKTTFQVVFDIRENELMLSAQDFDGVNEAKEQLPCEYNGDEMQIAFNAKFLSELLGVLPTEEALIRLSTPSRAALVVPSENLEGSNLLMLLMPIMVSH